MQDRVTVTELDLLDALREALERDAGGDDAPTTEELAEMTGISRERIKVALKGLIQSGKAESIRVRRLSIDGRNALVPGYRFKQAA